MNVHQALEEVRHRIAEAATRSGRQPESVTLVAVSKTVEVGRIQEAVDAGQRIFGENYWQEVRDKIPVLPADLEWHFIGHLQRNKASAVTGRFSLIHGIDSPQLVADLGRRAQAAGQVQDILIEVGLDPAATKHGVGAADLDGIVDVALGTPGIRLCGLMGMPPADALGEASRPYYARLRELAGTLPTACRGILSMGMTSDFEIAIEEGATVVRVGSAIFGRR